MSNKLAIVIPAYKSDFFSEALNSLAMQTNKDFTIYIGDDNSPFDLESIVSNFIDRLDIVYVKFKSNLGGTDLVGQWDRCVDLVADEEWVWLFSDDDVLENNCVEVFYNNLNKRPNADFFHFNIKVIDEFSEVKQIPNKFPAQLSVSDFHLLRWKSKLSSYVVEYIFRKVTFVEKGGFQNFKYAWHTDEATWTKLGHPGGILSLDGAFVRWRRSNVNITADNINPNVVKGKLDADLAFTKWIIDFYKTNNLVFSNTHKFYSAKRFTNHLFQNKVALSQGAWRKYLSEQADILQIRFFKIFFIMYYKYLERK